MTDAPTSEDTARWIDLARESDFSLGEAQVQPRAFAIVFEGVRIKLQPRVMQVLVALARAKGELVSRDALVDSCWGGLAVGEDAINRCIQRLRRLAEAETPGAYEIQTLPRIGYRLTSAAAPAAAELQVITLAVLPFVNMSADPEQEYFSDGLSEELLNQLAQVKRLRVPARTSCFAFKGKSLDVRIIGEQLGVAHVLEGSVRRAGERLRITAQLINCADGYHLWSEAFDRRLDDVFAIQEDVARAVTQALGVALGLDEGVLSQTAAPSDGTKNAEAYDRYLRARALYHQQGPAELRRAIEIFREAVTLDPKFILAWRGLFAAHVDALIYLAESAEDAFKGMGEAGGQILALAPDAWWSHALKADVFSHRHNWLEAETEARSAYEAAPAIEVEAAFTYGNLLAAVGRPNEGLDYVLELRRADPLSLRASSFAQALMDFTGRTAEAHAEYERSKDLAGDRGISEVLAFLRAMTNGHELSACREIALLAGLYGDAERAMAALRRGAADFEGGRISAIWHPVLAGARKTQAFKDMLVELRLVDYWRASGKWGEFARPAGDDAFECS